MVQLDATVSDSHDRPVSDLTADDFQVLLDGKPQKIVSCNWITAGVRTPAQPATQIAAARKSGATQPVMPAPALKREDVRRIIVLFVDDLSMSPDSIPRVRTGLRKFIETQLQPGDLAEIVRASAGLGALQDLTTDPSLLLAAVKQVRWNPLGRTATDYAPILGGFPMPAMGDKENAFRIESYTVATASSLWRVVRGMAPLPGRKSVVILSDSLPIRAPDEVSAFGTREVGSGTGGRILGAMRRVVDESMRAGVVLYAIDTRGLEPHVFSAESRGADPADPASRTSTFGPGAWVAECLGGGPGIMAQASQPPRPQISSPVENTPSTGATPQFPCSDLAYTQGQWGSMFLAQETGGFMVTEANRIEAAVERIMGDQRGYYLLSFTPPAAALAPDRNGKPVYHGLKVVATRPGLRVRSHQGFFGVSDEHLAADSPTPELQLSAALDSPFRSAGVGMEIESGFLSASKHDSFIRTAVLLDGRDLDLSGPPIHRTGVIHLVVRAFEVSGERVPGGIDQVLRIDLNEDGYERAVRYGLIYTSLLVVPKPGPYQVRAACRDESTGRIGNASDFIDVPKLKGMALSGLLFRRAAGIDDHVRPAVGASSYLPGERAPFVFQVMNAPKEPLTMRLRLYRDGKAVYEGPVQPVIRGDSKLPGRFFTEAALEIPAGLEPGDYLVRVDVAGPQPAPHQVAAWQWARLSVRASGQ